MSAPPSPIGADYIDVIDDDDDDVIDVSGDEEEDEPGPSNRPSSLLADNTLFHVAFVGRATGGFRSAGE